MCLKFQLTISEQPETVARATCSASSDHWDETIPELKEKVRAKWKKVIEG